MRRLARNDRTAVPAWHAAMSTETVEYPHPEYPAMAVHSLRCWSAHLWRWEHGRRTRQASESGQSRGSFWAWLLPRLDTRHPVWLWAHNLAYHLDALQIWELFETGELCWDAPAGPRRSGTPEGAGRRRRTGALVTGDPPTVVVCYSADGRKLVCVDLLNWLHQPPEWIAEALGVERHPRPGEVASDADWLAHCSRESAMTREAVCRVVSWVDGADAGNMRWTAAGQSMQAYRHWGSEPMPLLGDNLAVKAAERESYYTGRVECHYQGAVLESPLHRFAPGGGVPGGLPLRYEGPVYRLDVTACYPSVMADGIYPCQYVTTRYDMRAEELEQWLRSGCACACVLIADDMTPWPWRRATEVWWVTGRVRTVLCGPELARALHTGRVAHVAWAQLYAGGKLFTGFVARCWDGRLRAKRGGDAISQHLWKALSVSLHGKFSQRCHRWVDLDGLRAPTPWGCYTDTVAGTGERVVRRAVGWRVQELGKRGESPDGFPLIAAYATSYAREHMLALRLIAGADAVLYEDMDSLHVTRAGYLRLMRSGCIQDDRMGLLKVEQVARVAVYRGPRDYDMDGESVRCGWSPAGQMTERGVWAQTEFARLDAQLTGGKPPGPVSWLNELAPPVNPIRGRVRPDGHVEPIRVQDW